MNTYETTATVEDLGQVRVAGVPFAPGTEVEVMIRAKVAAHAGRPPANAMVMAMVTEENSPTRGSTPAMMENAIASGISASATTSPASTSVRSVAAENSGYLDNLVTPAARTRRPGMAMLIESP